MADRWFFDDEILRLEARAQGISAKRAAHSQPVHDCKLPPLSDNVAIVLCFNRGRSRDFRLLTQFRRIASVCLARNIRISIRWIPSEFNSAYDSTKRLVNHPGVRNRRSQLSRTWFDREPDICQGGSPAQPGKVASGHDLFPEILSGAAEETREEIQSPHVDGSCRCDGCDCSHSDGHETVSAHGAQCSSREKQRKETVQTIAQGPSEKQPRIDGKYPKVTACEKPSAGKTNARHVPKTHKTNTTHRC